MSLYLLSDCNPVLEQWEPTYVDLVKATLSIQGVEWLLMDCEVRASGGTALRTDYRCLAKLERCKVHANICCGEQTYVVTMLCWR